MKRRPKNHAEPVLASLLEASVGFACAESILAQAHAQSVLYSNAVAAQQQTAIVDLLALVGSTVTLLNGMKSPCVRPINGGNSHGLVNVSNIQELLKLANAEVWTAKEEVKAGRQDIRDATHLADEALQMMSGRPVVT